PAPRDSRPQRPGSGPGPPPDQPRPARQPRPDHRRAGGHPPLHVADGSGRSQRRRAAPARRPPHRLRAHRLRPQAGASRPPRRPPGGGGASLQERRGERGIAPPVSAGDLVLVVDDDDLVRKVVTAVLEADDYKVIEAANGAEALDKVKKHKPVLVILDVMMPGIDGVTVLQQMDHDDDVKVLMLTARDDTETEDASRSAGAHDFL